MTEPSNIGPLSSIFPIEILEALADPVFVKDEQHRWVLLNDAFCRFVGQPREALLGKSDFDFLPADQAEVFWAKDTEVFETGRTIENEELFTSSDGTIRTISTKKSLLTTSDGRKVLVGVIRDLTELKEKERELREARDRAERADSAKTLFLAQMSHEFRTPLNGIIGLTDLLLDRDLDSDVAEQLHLVRESSGHLLRLVNDLLHFSPLRAGGPERPPEKFHLRELVTSLHSFFEPLAVKARLRFQIQLADNVPLGVVGDPKALRQVLLNLVGNSLKFTPAGGEVRLEVESLPEHITRFRVVDTGIGISAGQQEEVFKPFVKLTPFAKGTGLGLTVVQELVQAMKGSLHLESLPGSGSVFTIEIPLQPYSVENKTNRPKTERNLAQLKGFKVLVVEDDAVSQKVAVLTLRKLGCEVALVNHGQEALEYLQTATPDLILLDCQMPVMDGFEFCRRLREWENTSPRPRLPVVALTAHALEEERRRCLEVGMDHWLTKPLQRGEVQNVLSAYYQAKLESEPGSI